MTADLGPQPLRGYVMRDYDDLIAALDRSRDSRGISMRELGRRAGVSAGTVSETLRGIHEVGGRGTFDLADALGYDLALIPREDAATRADPLCVWPNGVCTCGEPEGHTREDA